MLFVRRDVEDLMSLWWYWLSWKRGKSLYSSAWYNCLSTEGPLFYSITWCRKWRGNIAFRPEGLEECLYYTCPCWPPIPLLEHTLEGVEATVMPCICCSYMEAAEAVLLIYTFVGRWEGGGPRPVEVALPCWFNRPVPWRLEDATCLSWEEALMTWEAAGEATFHGGCYAGGDILSLHCCWRHLMQACPLCDASWPSYLSWWEVREVQRVHSCRLQRLTTLCAGYCYREGKFWRGGWRRLRGRGEPLERLLCHRGEEGDSCPHCMRPSEEELSLPCCPFTGGKRGPAVSQSLDCPATERLFTTAPFRLSREEKPERNEEAVDTEARESPALPRLLRHCLCCTWRKPWPWAPSLSFCGFSDVVAVLLFVWFFFPVPCSIEEQAGITHLTHIEALLT